MPNICPIKNNMKKRPGSWGEEQAAVFLIKKGYLLLDKNWRARPGEIDLVMKDGNQIVFVEVKARSGTRFGYPEEAVDDRKVEALVEAGQKYIDSHGLDDNWRIDVVSIIGSPSSGVRDIKHIKGF